MSEASEIAVRRRSWKGRKRRLVDLRLGVGEKGKRKRIGALSAVEIER